MEIAIFIVIITGLIILVNEIKNLNSIIESKYKIQINNLRSIFVVSICAVMFCQAFFFRNDWSIDNTIVLIVVTFSMFIYILCENMKNTNILYGLWITAYQLVVGMLILIFVLIVLKVLFPEKKRMIEINMVI